MTNITDFLPTPSPHRILVQFRQPSAREVALRERLDSGRAALPVLPKVVASALDLAKDPDASVASFARLIGSDPPIAARFVAIANSALYSRGREVHTLQECVMRVGLSASRDLLLQIAIAATGGGLKHFQTEVRESFARSVLAAHLCRLVDHEHGLASSDAYLCGLLHDIGESRVFRILSELDDECPSEEAHDLVQRYHARAGAELATRWKLPQTIVHTCKRHDRPGKPDSVELRIVCIADWLIATLDAAGQDPSLALEPDDLDALELDEQRALTLLGRAADLRNQIQGD